MEKLEQIISTAKKDFDLTEPDYQRSLYQVTNSLLQLQSPAPDELLSVAGDSSYPLEFRIAVQMARSKAYTIKANPSLKIAIVFAMWGEQNRLLPKSNKNPNGEDTLRTKVEQLNWLCDQCKDLHWRLYAVDDGCPEGSGKIAEEIRNELPQKDKDRVTVLFLEDGLGNTSGPLRNLKSANDSRKGGAIIMGSQQAINDGANTVIYTDADNSVHLGQVGILIEQYIENAAKVVLGNRKDPNSVLVKQENRWGIGIKLLRHMQRMVGYSIFSRGILDSQAAFKLYDSKILGNILENPSVFDFSFDSDWIAAAIQKNVKMAMVPFAFIDSFAESASIVQGPMTTWETLLLGLVTSVRSRELPHDESMAQVLEEEILSSADLDILIDHLPPQLENVKDQDLGDPTIMSPDEVRSWIIKRKGLESLSG